MDNYNETLSFLYNQVPMFQRVGAEAYKPGLDNSIKLAAAFGNPQNSFRTIHVAGTNGKGSVSHLIAATLMESGYRVGLYTSPHLIDFRERIKVDGQMIPETEVMDYVDKFKSMDIGISPSFFELTMVMAFDYFRKMNVDVAVIEVGLGGRLDSTNIISPDLSIITNISFDHTQFLGNTLAAIASEKAGIIKSGIPCVVGEYVAETKPVFQSRADEVDASIVFAEDAPEVVAHNYVDGMLCVESKTYGHIPCTLSGLCQVKNANTVLTASNILMKLGYNITKANVAEAFRNVCQTTGLMGRWMQIGTSPKQICDTGHNEGGISQIVEQLSCMDYNVLRIVIGFVSDKDITHILDLLPRSATYYFTNASVKRAIPAPELQKIAAEKGLNGKCYVSVTDAYYQALAEAGTDDLIFIGGSTFIVADLLTELNRQ
ncbi:MAG: bifunctional folylpolyglutamate synthase/dihydrofolate synthase [Muribaculaceae bacterium]